KFGIDPTGPDIHLGHTVPLWKLKQFQDLGHQVVLIIGDFTATIGDPSGRSEERKPLTKDDVKRNMERYIEQIQKILDIKKIEIRHNSEWHEKEGLEAVLQLTRTTTVQQLIERADFAERIKKGQGVTMIELLYPLLQGYDSVKVEADIEIGGTDQIFNLLMGRQVQSRYGQKEQDVITLPLLKGTDGVRKMSKSFGNYIALLDKPEDMFGKTMSISDEEIPEYFELVTPLPLNDLEKIKKQNISGKAARDLKLQLAETVTSVYWGDLEARKARDNFLNTFQKQELPDEIKEWNVSSTALSAEAVTEVGFSSSKSEASRLIKQGGVYINDKRVEDPKAKIPKKPFILRVGRRKIAKIIPK
ncbi:MAG: tyrosine--tRNA ligase, partial [Candidatus Spechtbacterales bacterium]